MCHQFLLGCTQNSDRMRCKRLWLQSTQFELQQRRINPNNRSWRRRHARFDVDEAQVNGIRARATDNGRATNADEQNSRHRVVNNRSVEAPTNKPNLVDECDASEYAHAADEFATTASCSDSADCDELLSDPVACTSWRRQEGVVVVWHHLKPSMFPCGPHKRFGRSSCLTHLAEWMNIKFLC